MFGVLPYARVTRVPSTRRNRELFRDGLDKPESSVLVDAWPMGALNRSLW